ncbi:TRAP transporter large permease subunit [Porticoccaceae bacterium]|jgi:C4-dicarboxylate transporter DctM subunit|nr:C4-dicarboxylate ABC transporter permease [Porticoccaceae bacterium]MDC1143829.1 TRAP transporter large permease subunit [Porticoccaceae bacterium]MDG2117151.1 TRAP transporter large permease subunit [Porticoccaceae bacterium]
MTAAFLLLVLFLLLLIGVPVAISLGFASITTMILFGNQSLLSLAQKFFHTMQVYPLLAVPFFILAGAFMTTGGVAKRMIDFANAIVGHYRGGLAMAALLASAFFAAVSGSAPATVVAVGSVMIVGMINSGYSKSFSAGVICNAGTLGILIPPSLVMVVYGAITESSIGKLFIAGIVPGIVMTIAMMATIMVIAKQQNLPRQPKAEVGEVLKSFKEASWGLMLIIIILGGIYAGLFTPTEAAAVSAVYAFFIAVFVYKDIGLKQVPTVLVDAAKITVMLMFIIANAFMFAFVLTTLQIPQIASEFIVGMGLPVWGFLLVLNILLLAAGNFMEPTSVVLILTPIVFPIAMEMGIDPIHLGVLMVVNMQIGLVTPPVGLNLFVTAGVAKMSLEDTIRASLPWLGVLLIVLMLITYIPWFSLVLPNSLGL